MMRSKKTDCKQSSFIWNLMQSARKALKRCNGKQRQSRGKRVIRRGTVRKAASINFGVPCFTNKFKVSSINSP